VGENWVSPFTVSVNEAEQTLQNIRAQMKGAGQFAWQALDQAAQVLFNQKDQSR
jgi:hypothetical protein